MILEVSDSIMSVGLDLKQQKKSWIGAPVKRKEDLRFITGNGSYVDDIHLDRMLYTAILRSPYAHAKITRVDLSNALALDGVVAAITGEEVVRLTQPFRQLMASPGDRIKDYCMAAKKVRYVGEPVAAVAATSTDIAYDAIELIEVDYEPMPVVTDSEQAMKDDAPLVHEEAGSNVLWHETFYYGNIEEAFREADVRVEEKFEFHRFSSTPLETNGVVASFDSKSGGLTVRCNNHMPMFAWECLIDSLKLPSDKLSIVMPDNGGGFGVKINNYPYLVLTSLLSMKTKRPVKWIETRREHMLGAGHGNERLFFVEAAAKSDGTILGLKVKTIDNEGAYFRYEPLGIILSLNVAPGCYKIRNIFLDTYAVATNKCPVSPNRGYGRMQHQFMIERIVDRIAQSLHMDTAHIRFKNFIQPNDFPYVTPTGAIYDSGDYPRCLKLLLDDLKYSKFREEQNE